MPYDLTRSHLSTLDDEAFYELIISVTGGRLVPGEWQRNDALCYVLRRLANKQLLIIQTK